MAEPQFQSSVIGQYDLRLESVAQTKGAINGRGFVICGERLVQTIVGGKQDRQGILKSRRLAVLAAGQCDSLSDGFLRCRDCPVEVATRAQQARSNNEALQALFKVRPRRACPKNVGLIE